MIRLMIPVLLVVAVFGCQGQDPQVPLDPFYGQTRITPPGTGEIVRRPNVDPYYPRSAAVSAPDGRIQPPPIVGNESSPAGPPTARLASSSAAAAGTRNQAGMASGDRIKIPVSAHRELSSAEILAARPSKSTPAPQRTADAAASTAASAGSLREPQRVVQTLVPREQSIARQSSGQPRPARKPGPATSRGGPVDINDLPPANRGAGTLRDDRVQQASAIEADGQVVVRIPTRVDAGDSLGRSGWADDYSRLRGQLEYRESDHCWKLRYIPIDREGDDFGGSVLIEDSASLSGFERGDFVEIRGHIAKPPEEGTDFAPVYHVASIRGLSR
jgi:hypothetical protein